MNADELKTASGEALDAAGASMHLDRVSKSHGHAFDESDDSYRRRLMAVLVGAAAAGAISQPAMVADDPMAPPKGLLEAEKEAAASDEAKADVSDAEETKPADPAKVDAPDSDSKLP